MRVRISDSEMAAAFAGLARLRPDVVVTRAVAPTPRGTPTTEFEVGLVGSLSSEARATAVGSLVRGWVTQLRGQRAGDVEVLR